MSATSSELKRRIVDAIRRHPSPARRVVLLNTIWLVLAIVVVDVGLFCALGGPSRGTGSMAYLLFTEAGWAIIACVAVWIAFGRGRSMLGRPRRWLFAIAVVLPFALFGWMLLAATVFPPTLTAESRHGCTAMTLALAIWPTTLYALVRPESVPLSPGMTGAARAAAIGACVGVLTRWWCPGGKLIHLALSHALPLLVLSGFGWLLGQRLGRVYRRPSGQN